MKGSRRQQDTYIKHESQKKCNMGGLYLMTEYPDCVDNRVLLYAGWMIGSTVDGYFLFCGQSECGMDFFFFNEALEKVTKC